MAEITRRDLEGMVRRALAEIAAEGAGPAGAGSAAAGDSSFKRADPSGVMAFRAALVRPEPFDTGKPGDRVYLKDMAGLSESPRLGFGIMEMDRSVFKWTLNYDEVDYVIDGTLEILIDGRKVVGRAGDVIFIPARSSIEFSAPGFVRFFYVVYPADWYNQ